jgi:hypothetical protein
MPEAKPATPKAIEMVLITAILVGALIYFVIALNTQDLQWFLPGFNEQPRQMIVHCYGNDVEVKPSTAFEAITEAFNDAFSGRKRWDQLTMSENTYQEYLDSPNMMTLELVYDPAVRVHSPYAFYKNVNRLFVPLDGRHASSNSIFGRRGDFTLSGSFHINSIAPILEAVQENGICQKP